MIPGLRSRRRIPNGAMAALGVVVAGCIAIPLPPPPDSSPTGLTPASASPGPTRSATAIASPEPSIAIPGNDEPSAASLAGVPCTVEALAFQARDLGAGLGNAAAAVTVRNDGPVKCAVGGYPRVVLVNRTGQALRTDWRAATDGAYLFPAAPAQEIDLPTGDRATFAIGYSDNPFGPLADQPYDVACPPAASLRVYPSDAPRFGTAMIQIAPCSGLIEVSPWVAGPDPPRF